MNLQLRRTVRGRWATLGELRIDGVFECFTLEDRDRGLNGAWSVEAIRHVKVYGRTAIPAGVYTVVITWSPRFRAEMPLLVGVPGFEGVRIHTGNTHNDTEGCILVGEIWDIRADFIGRSRLAYAKLFVKLKAAAKRGEPITLTIE